jgi:divalent metal cation (Fe/Co/Zn/Cd) transporter
MDVAQPVSFEAVTERRAVARRGRHLQYATIAWNSGEFIVAVIAGVLSGSVALVGFGIDSAIEVTSSLAALWRLRRDTDDAARARAERRSLQAIGVCFLLLAAYVVFDAALSLVRRQAPDASVTGLVLAALSLVVMPALVLFKRRVARSLASGALAAESRQTEICAYLSAILLVGLGLNAALGWWWADSVAALLMAPLIAREGWQALRGHDCCH